MCVCVCVCVIEAEIDRGCLRERWRETDSARGNKDSSNYVYQKRL